MENLPSIDEILENKYFQVGMIVWVVFFSGCITRMVPDNLRRLLDHPVVKVGVLALVVYLADRDFKLAVIVATGFFLSTAPLNVKEGMACSGTSDSLAMNSKTCTLTATGTECTDDICPGNTLGDGYCSLNESKHCHKALCKEDCDGSAGDSNKCQWNSAENKCHVKCVTVTEQEQCNTTDNSDPAKVGNFCQWNANQNTCSTKSD
tara:strand:- start:1210 stop:1827 length:618 start_codon:yes stop_codon:yes gene_type:complete